MTLSPGFQPSDQQIADWGRMVVSDHSRRELASPGPGMPIDDVVAWVKKSLESIPAGSLLHVPVSPRNARILIESGKLSPAELVRLQFS